MSLIDAITDLSFLLPCNASSCPCATVSQMFLKPPGGLYTLPYLTDSLQDDADTLTRAEWWEVLFFIKKLEPKQQQEINNILRQNLDEQAITVS